MAARAKKLRYVESVSNKRSVINVIRSDERESVVCVIPKSDTIEQRYWADECVGHWIFHGM
jgi:hypothetical protein